MPSFHADPDCSLTAAPSVPTLVNTADPALHGSCLALWLSPCLARPGQPRFLCWESCAVLRDNMCNWLSQLSQLCPAWSPDPPVFNNVVATSPLQPTGLPSSQWQPRSGLNVQAAIPVWPRHAPRPPPGLLASSCSLLYYNVQTPAPQLQPSLSCLVICFSLYFSCKKFNVAIFFS